MDLARDVIRAVELNKCSTNDKLSTTNLTNLGSRPTFALTCGLIS